MAHDEDMETQAPVKSPCNGVCQINPRSGFCAGCARTRDEIAEWGVASLARQRTILAELPGRLTG